MLEVLLLLLLLLHRKQLLLLLLLLLLLYCGLWRLFLSFHKAAMLQKRQQLRLLYGYGPIPILN